MAVIDLPDDDVERAIYLQNIMISCATGGDHPVTDYSTLRKYFLGMDSTKGVMPEFVRTCRDLDAFWGWVKFEESTYAGRRTLIRQAFQPLLDLLELSGASPLDQPISDTLETFDAEGVNRVWSKALSRRQSDPEGAITAARTLLETVCKHIVEANSGQYSDRDDLPKLYAEASRALNVAPSQHTEEVFKQVLGGCTSIVIGLGTLRNRISDSHGQGRRPVRPAPRHATLAVNLAGTMAMFLIETWEARNTP